MSLKTYVLYSPWKRPLRHSLRSYQSVAGQPFWLKFPWVGLGLSLASARQWRACKGLPIPCRYEDGLQCSAVHSAISWCRRGDTLSDVCWDHASGLLSLVWVSTRRRPGIGCRESFLNRGPWCPNPSGVALPACDHSAPCVTPRLRHLPCSTPCLLRTPCVRRAPALARSVLFPSLLGRVASRIGRVIQQVWQRGASGRSHL